MLAVMLRIDKTSTDAFTGHISVDAQVHEVEGNSTTLGALETHGIAAHELQTRFGGDVKAWLKNVHAGMLQRHEARKIAAQAAQALRGVTMFNEKDEDTTSGNHPAPAGDKV